MQLHGFLLSSMFWSYWIYIYSMIMLIKGAIRKPWVCFSPIWQCRGYVNNNSYHWHSANFRLFTVYAVKEVYTHRNVSFPEIFTLAPYFTTDFASGSWAWLPAGSWGSSQNWMMAKKTTLFSSPINPPPPAPLKRLKKHAYLASQTTYIETWKPDKT